MLPHERRGRGSSGVQRSVSRQPSSPPLARHTGGWDGAAHRPRGAQEQVVHGPGGVLDDERRGGSLLCRGGHGPRECVRRRVARLLHGERADLVRGARAVPRGRRRRHGRSRRQHLRRTVRGEPVRGADREGTPAGSHGAGAVRRAVLATQGRCGGASGPESRRTGQRCAPTQHRPRRCGRGGALRARQVGRATVIRARAEVTLKRCAAE
mmetsp:Transcript_4587/g.11004  ORF Transcript_4587/g.11004 Transcript_4587/m.11004 type:complete len:210 (-) Transcript_4587:170-799(-)